MTTLSPPEQATNAELIRWAFEMLNEHDVTPLKQFWGADTVERFPERTCRGGEEIAGYFEDTFRAIPDFHMEIVAIAEQNEDVFVHWHLTGTHQGPIQGIQATGKKVEVDGIDHFVIRDGKVISNFVVFDQMQYALQLGMLPPPNSAGDRVFKRAFNLRTRLASRIQR